MVTVTMGHVDALSRDLPVTVHETDDISSCTFTIQEEDMDFYLQATQTRDPVLVKLRTQLETETIDNFDLINGLVYRCITSGLKALYVPEEMEANIIRLIHEKLAHLGCEKCYNQIRLQYWFPGMMRKIRLYIQNCLRCIMHTAPHRALERELHSIPKEPFPFDTVHVDHFGPLPQIINKNNHILVVIVAFTKFIKLYPVNTTSSKEVRSALDKYFAYYSHPRRLISDRGTAFTSKELAEYMLENNIHHIKTAVASPQVNGQVERVNRVMGRMLSKIVEPVNQSNWSKCLTKIEYAVNNSIHSTTKQSPSVLLFGVSQLGSEIEYLTEYLEEKGLCPQSRDLLSIRTNANQLIQESQKTNEIQYTKRSVLPLKFQVGDYVVMKNVDTTVGSNKKLIPKYRGPHVIHRVLVNDRYVIRGVENCQVTQIPYNGVLEASRLKPWVRTRNETAEVVPRRNLHEIDRNPDRGRSEMSIG